MPKATCRMTSRASLCMASCTSRRCTPCPICNSLIFAHTSRVFVFETGKMLLCRTLELDQVPLYGPKVSFPVLERQNGFYLWEEIEMKRTFNFYHT